MVFADRRDAGAKLAKLLDAYAGRSEDVCVLALPRGGVPVGYEIATHLNVPLDVLVVRKLGVPGYEELAMGAVASGGALVFDRTVASAFGVSDALVGKVIERERAELDRREHAFIGDRPHLDIKDRIVILVDDGLATGSTMLAAVRAVRVREPLRIIVAAPVGAPQTVRLLRQQVHNVVVLVTPPNLRAVGLWYEDFTQTSDEEVHELLAPNAARELTSIA